MFKYFILLLIVSPISSMTLNPIDSFLNKIKNYYHGKPVLENSWANPINDNGMNRLVDKMFKKKFVIGVIGSSVAAGHDNCNYDSFEKQLERTLQPIFAHYGKEVEVRNAGEGGGCGDTYRNQIWCMRHMIGDDVDSVIYTWSYFESGDRTINEWHETFIRWALLLDNAPVPFIMNVGEGRLGDPLYQHYKDFGYSTFYLEKGLKKFNPSYKKEWGVIGNGFNNSTRYGGSGIMWRNWLVLELFFGIVFLNCFF